MKKLIIPFMILLVKMTFGQTNYYTKNDGSALLTEDQVRSENKRYDISRKLRPELNFKPVIYHKEIRKDSIINYFNFISSAGDTVVPVAFKFIYEPDPIFRYLNKKIPDFMLKDTKGIEFKSSQLMGKPTLLNFSGTYCGACVAEIPYLNKLKNKYGDKVNFISIADVERRPGGLKTYLQLYSNFQFRILENTVAYKKAFNSERLPRNIFLDKNGIVRNIQLGYRNDSSDPKDNYFVKILDELTGVKR